MLITMAQAKEVLNIATDTTYYDDEVTMLMNAIPAYLLRTTGHDWDNTDVDAVNPLAKLATRQVLKLWFEPRDVDSDRTLKGLNATLATLTTLGRCLDTTD